MKDHITLRTSIKPKLKNFVLKRGTLLGGLGSIILLYGGSVMTPAQLSFWGIPILILGIGLITLGMIPYRKLSQMENSPDEIVLDQEALIYFKKGKKVFTLSQKSIASTTYIDRDNRYGVAINLKDPIPEKIVVHNQHFPMASFQEDAKKHFDCDVFLAHFSESSQEEIEEVLSAENEE